MWKGMDSFVILPNRAAWFWQCTRMNRPIAFTQACTKDIINLLRVFYGPWLFGVSILWYIFQGQGDIVISPELSLNVCAYTVQLLDFLHNPICATSMQSGYETPILLVYLLLRKRICCMWEDFLVYFGLHSSTTWLSKDINGPRLRTGLSPSQTWLFDSASPGLSWPCSHDINPHWYVCSCS